jgi:hypothetical protein
MRDDRIGVSGFADEEGHRNLAKTFVRYANHGSIEDAGEQSQYFLDGIGVDLVTSPIDHVSGTTLDPHEPVVVDSGKIAGIDESIGIHPLLDADC